MDSLNKELWRIRINWIFTLFVCPLFTISQIGTCSSFHQFVTNPRINELSLASQEEVVQSNAVAILNTIAFKFSNNAMCVHVLPL